VAAWQGSALFCFTRERELLQVLQWTWRAAASMGSGISTRAKAVQQRGTRRAFQNIDTNESKKLSFSELKAAGLAVDESRLLEGLRFFDTNHDGELDQAEFDAAVKYLSQLTVVSIGGRTGWYVDQVSFTLSDGRVLKCDGGEGGGKKPPQPLKISEHIVAVEHEVSGNYLGAGFTFILNSGREITVAGTQDGYDTNKVKRINN
jgi:hypothetical protein